MGEGSQPSAKLPPLQGRLGSGMLTELRFTLAWWLRKPMLWLVRYRVAPDQVPARLNLDPNRPVCFVLPERSWSDLFVLDRVCRDQGLPRPYRTGSDLPTL